MDRRLFVKAGLASMALAPFAATSARAEQLSLDQISAYLNQLFTAIAPFEQRNADGSRSRGTVYIRRPGRIRFEYEPPNKSLVIAGQGQVAVFDEASNQPPQEFQLANTPLKIVLFDNVDLRRSKLVRGVSFDGTHTIVRAQDPKYAEYGFIDLYFTNDPAPALARWTLTDGSGGQTTVFLGAMETGMRLRGTLFNVDDELAARGF